MNKFFLVTAATWFLAACQTTTQEAQSPEPAPEAKAETIATSTAPLAPVTANDNGTYTLAASFVEADKVATDCLFDTKGTGGMAYSIGGDLRGESKTSVLKFQDGKRASPAVEKAFLNCIRKNL